MKPSLGKYIRASLLAHGAFFLIALFLPKLFHFIPKSETKIQFVRLAKGTGDTNQAFKKSENLPESTLREQKDILKELPPDPKAKEATKAPPPEKKQPIKQTPKKTVKAKNPVAQKKKPENSADKAMADALAKIDKTYKQRQVEIEAAQVPKEGSGQSPDGTLDPQEGETNPYTESVITKIKKEWVLLPQSGNNQTFITRINIRIDATGQLLEATYDVRSGDASFDLSAMRAIERAAPFPAPPDDLKALVTSEGFSIEFNPKNIVGR